MSKIAPTTPAVALEIGTDMQNIPTLDEAIDACDALRDACDTLRRFLEGVDATFRSSRVHKPAAPGPEPTESVGKTASHDNGKTATWPERVRAILGQANEPLAAKDVIRIYHELHDSGEISLEDVGNRIRSVLWQLKERGHLIHDEGKYRLKERPP